MHACVGGRGRDEFVDSVLRPSGRETSGLVSFSVQSMKKHLMTLAEPPLQGNMFLECSSQKLGEPLSLHPTNE